MLVHFECENFRGFKERLVFDLAAHTYEFGSDLVKDGVVKNVLIYGPNGIGKSSLGMALFDVVGHLTDNKPMSAELLDPYVNLDSTAKSVAFKHKFKFQEGWVTYEYEKDRPDHLIHESLWFDNDLVLDWNHANSEGNLYREDILGAINLEKRDPQVSVVKYVYRTQKSKGHALMIRMMKFLESMLWFRRLSDGPGYAGFQVKREYLGEAIIQKGKLKEFERFLHKHGLDYVLESAKVGGHDVIMVKFENGRAPFADVASSGTINLELFFYWSIAAFPSVSLLFIDEYDAYFHYESSRALLEMLNKSVGFQVFLTTHNTYLMQNGLTRPDACYLMSRTKERGHRIVALCDATEKEIRLAHNLEKMYTHGVFREF